MSYGRPISEYFTSLPSQTQGMSTCSIFNFINGAIRLMSQAALQETLLNPRKTPAGINIDTEQVNGIFSLGACAGTKPGNYGVVIKLGYGSDWYDLAITSQSELLIRINTNNRIGVWKRLAMDASYVAPQSNSDLRGG